MDRIFDKAIVLLCCLPSLALAQVDASLVAALLISVGITSACEAAYLGQSRAMSAASVALTAGYLVVACFVPAAVPFAAFSVYDLACRRATAPLALLAIATLIAAGSAGLPAAEIIVGVCSCATAAGLSLRTGQLQTLRADNMHERDELRERSLALEKSNRDLLDRQEYEARLATLTERGRIAREIHDNVGHLLTRGIMQVEALRVVHANDNQIQAEFGTVADTLREALDTMRSSVHGMADETCDLSVQVRHVVDETCRDTGLSASCSIAATTASPQVTACLTAVVREALSNTLRHANGATHVSVELLEHPSMWRLTIADNGLPPARAGRAEKNTAGAGVSGGAMVAGEAGASVAAEALAGGPAVSGSAEIPSGTGMGMGLASMEQRVRSLGGTMSAGYSDSAHGFVVHVSIPREGTAS
jgi:signal transduction histidine kinase